jgi:hypothetical protein
MIPLEEAEQRVETLVWELWGNEPYEEVTIIPGTNHDDEVADIKQDIRALDPEEPGYLKSVRDKQAEIERLRGLPRKDDEVIRRIVPGITRADVWMMGPTVADQRRALLRWVGKLYAYREPTPDDPKAFAIRAA